MSTMKHEHVITAMEKLHFRVEGMDCASCVSKIEKALMKFEGLTNIEVNFATETLSLNRKREGKIKISDITKKVQSLGFEIKQLLKEPVSIKHTDKHHHHEHECDGHHHEENHGHEAEHVCSTDDVMHTNVSEPSTQPDVTMKIEGMDCASCIGKIETALKRLPEIADMRVNFTTETLDVWFVSDSPRSLEATQRVIKNLGFGISKTQHRENKINSSDAPALEPIPRWWQTKKGKLVISLGALMGAAYVLSNILPINVEWLFTVAVLIGIIPFARKALALAFSGSPFSIEMLMVVASVGALGIGEAEEAAAVVFLFAVGELLESVAAGRARAGIKALASLVPRTAVLLDNKGKERIVPVTSLQPGDQVLVRPGDRVPADGVILKGGSSLDESPITGESIPIFKGVTNTVFAGSINIDGLLEVEVEKTASDNTIARIIHLVEQAQSKKAPTARFIERFSQYYTPVVMGIAALIIILPPLFTGADWDTWLYRGLALLLIACPCALVLSTPAAIASGLAVATKRGLLIKGGHALETIGKVRAIAFDKTGTLTEGKPRVTNVVPFGVKSQSEILAIAAAVETGSNHPLAQAIVSHARDTNIASLQASNSFTHAGKGVYATVNELTYVVGSPNMAAEVANFSAFHKEAIESLEESGKTVVVLFEEKDGVVIGLIALRDEPRADAKKGLAALKAMGVSSVMLTGDNRRAAKAIANDLEIDWKAELLPQDKLQVITSLKQKVPVAMIGDGINDAPALATADVGIAMGGGTDVALETADAALLKNRVVDVAELIAISRTTMTNIHQNVTLAIGLKAVFLITSVLGITGLWVAVLADTGATALVTLNALRILRFKKQEARL